MTDPYKGAPEHYKHPNDRAHIWDGMQAPVKAVEPPSKDWPRHVHKAHGEHKEVWEQQSLDKAIADGWQLEPPKVADAPAADAPADR